MRRHDATFLNMSENLLFVHSEIIKGVEKRFAERHKDALYIDYSAKNLGLDLKIYVEKEEKKLGRLYKHFNSGTSHLSKRTIERALKRENLGKNDGATMQLLHLFCIYAYDKDWQPNLERIGFKKISNSSKNGNENISKGKNLNEESIKEKFKPNLPKKVEKLLLNADKTAQNIADGRATTKEIAETQWRHLLNQPIDSLELLLLFDKNVSSEMLIRLINKTSITYTEDSTTEITLISLLESCPLPNLIINHKEKLKTHYSLWKAVENGSEIWYKELQIASNIPNEVGGFEVYIPWKEIGLTDINKLEDILSLQHFGIAFPAELFFRESESNNNAN